MKLQNLDFAAEITAPPSKSVAIRGLILSALCNQPTLLSLSSACRDIDVCAAAIRTLGAKAEWVPEGIRVTPHFYDTEKDGFIPDFADCATALRLMAPVYHALTGKKLTYTASPRLSARVASAGALYGAKGNDGSVTVNTGISSQTASGELLALSLTGGTLCVSGEAVSRPYLELTAAMLTHFGAAAETKDSRTFRVERTALGLTENILRIDSDASSIAFLLLAGVLGSHPVTVKNTVFRFPQGDFAILSALRNCGASISENGADITAFPSTLAPFDYDAKDTPDLVPPLAVAACACAAPSFLRNIARLRFKESDRVAEICAAVRSLGGFAEEREGSLCIHGPLHGGNLPRTADHRIAMMGVLLSLLTKEAVTTESLSCVGKSYPDFDKTF